MLKSLKILFTHSHLIPFYLIILFLLIYFTKFSYKNISALSKKTKKLLIYARIIVWVIIIISLINPLIQYFFDKIEKSKVVLLMDNSLSMMIKDKNNQTRFNKAKDILNHKIFNYLSMNFNLQYFLFSRELKPSDKQNILLAKSPEGDITDIGGALLKTALSGGEYMHNIVLLSDGINNVYHDMPRIANQLKKKNIKIYSIQLDQDENIKDISLMDIESPFEINVNTKLNLKIKINSIRYHSTPLTIKTYINDKLYSTKTVNIKAGLNKRIIPVIIKNMGINKITMTCSSMPDESILLNNSKTIFIRTIKSKFKVLLIYGQPSFEYKFLKLAMETDPNILSDTYLKIKNNLGNIENLTKYDLVIIGNIRYKDIPVNLVDKLVYYANHKSGAMLFLGGKNSFESGDYHTSKLKNIIPVAWGRSGGFIKSDFTLKLSSSGINSSAMQIISDINRLQEYWDNLPPCNLINVIKKVKPGTDIIAVSSKNPDLIVLALGTYKRARIGIFSAYPTWKWGFLNVGMGYSENPFDIFWQQFIRHMISFNLEKINLFTNKLEYNKNEDIFTTLTFFDENYKPIRQSKIPAVLFKKVKNEYHKINSFYLYPSSATKGVYETITSAKEYGEYKIGIDMGKYKAKTFFLIKNPEEELFNLKADNRLLDSLYDITGGKYLKPHEINQIKNLIKRKEIKRKIKKEKNFWSNWFLLILVIGLLSTEWYIRKKNGLM